MVGKRVNGEGGYQTILLRRFIFQRPRYRYAQTKTSEGWFFDPPGWKKPGGSIETLLLKNE
jgi:hypothetical protein